MSLRTNREGFRATPGGGAEGAVVVVVVVGADELDPMVDPMVDVDAEPDGRITDEDELATSGAEV